MDPRPLRLLFGFVIAAFACPLIAQDAATTEETASKEVTYFDLRRSRDHATKQFADRYFNLVKPQEWVSLNGKSKIVAKYVAHDPNLAWVKLSSVRGAGANRTTREMTVEVAKLNKTCQSRVRQISVLQAKLDELVVEEKEREAESDSSDASRGEYGNEGGRYGEEMDSGRDGGRDRYGDGESTAAEPAATEYPSASDPAADEAMVPDGSDDPDPLGFADLENELAAAAAGENAAPTSGRALAYGRYSGGLSDAGENVGASEQAPWKTSYAAFAANLTASQGAGGVLNVDWGALTELRQMNEAAEAGSRNPSDASRSQVAEIANRIGEVQWEGTFAGLGESSDGRQEIQFDLPSVSPPLAVRFFADEREAGPWTELRPGTPVRFAGRFDIRQPLEIQVLVRKLD